MTHIVDEKVVTEGMYPEKATTELGTSLRKHTLEDVELALMTLAYNGGNVSVTVAELEETKKIVLAAPTLMRWRDTLFAQKYANIQKQLQSDINNKLAGILAENGIRSAQAQRAIIERLAVEVNSLRPKELASAARELAQVQSVAIEKGQLLRGLPTQRIEERKPEDVIDQLNDIIPASAEEIDE